MKNHPVGAELFHVDWQMDGQTDSHDELIVTLCNFANMAKNIFRLLRINKPPFWSYINDIFIHLILMRTLIQLWSPVLRNCLFLEMDITDLEEHAASICMVEVTTVRKYS